MASRGGRSVTASLGGQGPRPPGTTTWVRGARCIRSGANAGERSAAPGAQNRHGGAPRGERPALWDARRLARRLTRRVISAFTRVFDARRRAPRVFRRAPERFSALRPPLDSGSVKQTMLTPDAHMRRGNDGVRVVRDCESLGQDEAPTCGCGKRTPAALHCFRVVIYNEWRNSNVSGRRRAAAAPVAGRALRVRRAVTACRLNRSRGRP